MREIRCTGRRPLHHTRVGVGGRLDALQCAVLLAKLECFERDVSRRIAIGRRYDALLPSRLRRIT
jgi:UDP-2-acetamido-2-deoxy-ribo-hexuluronate aminotransferase